MYTLLFVDDEPHILKAYSRVFMDEPYTLLFADSAENALETMKDNRIDIIITDIRMPGMDGATLLKEIRKSYPHILRVVMSAYAEKELITKIISSGTARAFMSKPWDNEELKSKVSQICEVLSQTQTDSVTRVIDQIENIPVLPDVYSKILKQIESGESIPKIAQTIEVVPDYTARLLRIINSAIYGISTASVQKAILYLGLDTVKNVVLTTEIFDSLGKKCQDKSGMALLWRQSLISNKLLTGFHKELFGRKIEDEYIAAGLLYDIGTLLIAHYFPDIHHKIQQKKKDNPELSLPQIEKELLGITHMQFGALLMEWWNLPIHVVGGCLYHHGPFLQNVGNPKFNALLHCADVCSWNSLSRDNRREIDPCALKLLDVSQDKISLLSKKILNKGGER